MISEKGSGYIIRAALVDDVEQLLDIYEPYITDTTVTFEYSVPSTEDYTARFLRIASVYPYLVCEKDGRIIGYAYADAPFSSRSAYAWDVDISIYIESSSQHSGIGSAMFGALHELLRLLGYRNSYALITGENTASLAFHEKFGYNTVGIMKKSGYKLGRWIDVVWMEYLINDTGCSPALPTAVNTLKPEQISRICAKYE